MPPFCPESLVWLLHLQRQPPCPCEGGTSSDSRWGWGRLTSGCCLLLSDKGCSTDSCWLVSLPVLLGEGVGVRWQWGVGRGGPSVLALLWAPRLTGLEESAWGDDDEATDHNYYNSIPGKEPPLGGLVDSRLAVTQPCALAALGGLGQVSLPPLWGRGGLELSLGWVSVKRAWRMAGPPCFSCRACHPHGEMPEACRGTWVPPEQVGCANLTESGVPRNAPSPANLSVIVQLCPTAVCSRIYPHPAIFIASRSEVITFWGTLTSELQGRRSPVRLCLLPVP